MTIHTPVTQALDTLGLPYRTFTHTNPVRSLEQAAAERDQQPAQVVRSLLFRLSAESYVMVLVAGPQQIPWPALRRHLGESRLTMASREELLAVTGYEPGTVAPFGLRQSVRLLIDQTVLTPDEISLGSGQRNTAVILATSDLRRALPHAEPVNLYQKQSE